MNLSDQAAGLRRLAGEAPSPQPQRLPALAITGGKGGVGKTCVAVNLAIMLVKLGLKPLLVDCDLGLANADVLLGVNPEITLFEVVMGGIPLAEALIKAPHGLHFIPAASGREELTRLSQRQLSSLIAQLGKAAQDHDLLLFDTMAGISAEVTGFLKVAHVVVVVVTPDPTSLTDAYALMKVLDGQAPGRDLRVLVNQASSDDEAQAVFQRLRKVCQQYLKREVTWLGSLPRDALVTESVRRRTPFATSNCPAALALKGIAQRLKGVTWR